MITGVAFIILALLYVAEARHDRDVEIAQKPVRELIQAWHKSDAYFHLTLNIGVSWWMFVLMPTLLGLPIMWIQAIIFGLTMLGYRQMFMAIPLNLMRGRHPFHLGTHSDFDKFFSKYRWLPYVTGVLMALIGTFFFLWL